MNRRTFIGGCVASPLVATLGSCAATAHSQMATREIPSSGERLPVVGYGGARVFGTNDMDRIRELLDILTSRGGRVVDAHGPMEEMYGKYMLERKDFSSLFVASNIGSSEKSAGEQRIGRSLDSLGKQSMDLLMLNRTNDPYPFVDYMREWKEAGTIRHTGFAFSGSGFIDTAVDLVERRDVDVVMASYSMVEPKAADRLLPAAKDNGAAVITNRPFLNGTYFKRVAGKPLPSWVADFDCETWAQFSLKYILGHPAVTCVISETGNPVHAIDNLSAGFGRIPNEETRQKMRSYLLSL